MPDLLPIYGCLGQLDATAGIERLFVAGKAYVRAYVPEADADLRNAYHVAALKPDSVEAGALLSELVRRGLYGRWA